MSIRRNALQVENKRIYNTIMENPLLRNMWVILAEGHLAYVSQPVAEPGLVLNPLDDCLKHAQYSCDITCVTVTEPTAGTVPRTVHAGRFTYTFREDRGKIWHIHVK